MNASTLSRSTSSRVLLCVAIALTFGFVPAHAQEMDHSQMEMPLATPESPAEKPAATPAAKEQKVPDSHADHAMQTSAPLTTRESAAGDSAVEQDKPTQHDTHTEPMDHSAMGHEMPMPQEPAQPMDHSAMGHDMSMSPDQPRQPIPPLTDADRTAAFPDVGGHPVHDNSLQKYVLVDQLEAWDADEGNALAWEALGWVGTDLNRVWLRSEGERVDSATKSADIEVLYGRSVARWWDVVAGVRHDFGAGPSQTFAAIGVVGLAPYKFDVEATAYIGDSGQSAARLQAEYDTLLTNRLILQWLAEAELYGKDDARRGVGSGLSTIQAALRLRYEFTRQFAPYIGLVWERAYGDTADLRRDEGEDIDDTRFVAGLRIWF
jgi:copper resistance protein B